MTFESLTSLRTNFEQDIALDHSGKYRIQKLANAAEKAFADRALLLDENRLFKKIMRKQLDYRSGQL